MRGMKVRSAQTAGIVDYDVDNCHALVIGINRYKEWPSLRSAANDAQSIADLLKTHFGYKDVVLLLDEQATRINILTALDKFTRLTEQDNLLIYYAGHGWMDDYQNGFWVPYEAPRDAKFDYVANSFIVNDYFKKYRVRHLLVVADSCFSGTLMRGVSQEREERWKLPSGFRKPSRWVMTSGDLAPVPDDAGGGHSPFATRLLQFLQYSDEPAFGIHDLYVYVRKTMKTEPLCEPINTPMHMPGGEFVFCRLENPLPSETLHDAAPTIRAAPSVTLPTVQPVVRYGALVINSPVDGVVSIDGQGAYLITPTQNLRWGKLPAGTHNITVQAGEQQWEDRIQVVADQTVTISAALDTGQDRLSAAAAAREERARLAEQIKKQEEEEALRKQRLYQLELERKQQEELVAAQLDDARARRALEIKLQREAEQEATEKKVRRPKVH